MLLWGNHCLDELRAFSLTLSICRRWLGCRGRSQALVFRPSVVGQTVDHDFTRAKNKLPDVRDGRQAEPDIEYTSCTRENTKKFSIAFTSRSHHIVLCQSSECRCWPSLMNLAARHCYFHMSDVLQIRYKSHASVTMIATVHARNVHMTLPMTYTAKN